MARRLHVNQQVGQVPGQALTNFLISRVAVEVVHLLGIIQIVELPIRLPRVVDEFMTHASDHLNGATLREDVFPLRRVTAGQRLARTPALDLGGDVDAGAREQGRTQVDEFDGVLDDGSSFPTRSPNDQKYAEPDVVEHGILVDALGEHAEMP